MGYDKSRSLFDNIVTRITKKLGQPLGKLEPEIQTFITTSVEGLLRLGNISIADINQVARQAKQLMPRPTPSVAATESHQSINMSNASNSSVVPSPPHGSVARRATVEARLDRMAREADVAQRMAEDLKKYEQEEAKRKVDKHHQMRDLKQNLTSQMENAIDRKVQRKRQEQAAMQTYLNQLNEKEEAEQALENARRRQQLEERASIEGEMRKQIEEKRQRQLQEKEAEKEYLAEVLNHEAKQREADRQRKERSREELRSFLSQNNEAQAKKKKDMEVQRVKEREVIEQNKAVMLQREEQAKREVARRNTRGIIHAKRQDAIMEQYLQMQHKEQEKALREEVMREKEAEAKRARDEAVDQARRQRRMDLRQELVHSLEGQITERHDAKKHEDDDDHQMRKQTERNVLYGIGSDDDVRRREARRKTEILTTLDRQIAEKRAQQRHELRVKI